MSVFSSLNDKLGAERERLVHVKEELLHGRVALDEHAFGHVDHDGGGGGTVRRIPRGETGRSLLSLGVGVGGDEVVEDDQEEEGDAEHVGQHGELRVRDHFVVSLVRPQKILIDNYNYVAQLRLNHESQQSRRLNCRVTQPLSKNN